MVKGNDDLMKVQKDNLEFDALSRELTPCIQISEPMINENEVDWRERLREDCINAIATPSNVSEEVKENSDDDNVEEEDDTQEKAVS